MRVLIVNAHAQNAEGQKAFQDLLVCIKEQLKAYNGLLEIKDECIIRTKDNLEDFLYDEYTSFSQANCGKNFDSLDFIIISGELHILPWNHTNYKVLTLLRMCVKVKKCLFAIGFGMQALVFLSASNLNHSINVINGNGKGGKLGDMGQLNLQHKKIASYDYFLDSVTGDLYHLQQETNEWTPVCNIGMHHSRTAQEFNTLGKFVIKTPIYRPKKSIHNSEKATVFDENVERKCYIKKIYLNHWLFHNCDMEFVVPYKGRWEVHSFNFTTKEKAFDILAESEQGALVIEYPRIVGIKFLVSKRYKETYQMFSNFFTKYADQIRDTGKSQMISILSYTNYAKTQARAVKFEIPRQYPAPPESNRNTVRTGTAGGKTMQSLKNIGSVNELIMTGSDDQDHQVFKHSGMATKMKGKFILDHNYIGTGKVRNEMSPSRNTSDKRFLSKEAITQRYAVAPPKIQEDDDDFSFLESHRDVFSRFDGKSILKTANSKHHHHRHISKESAYGDLNSMSKRAHTENDALLTKEDARRWLYPELKETNGFDKKNWIPGNLSKTKAENFFGSKTIRISTGFADYRKKGSVPTLNFNEQSQRSLRASDPYVTYHDVAKQHQKNEDGKILGTRTFVLSRGTPSINSVSPSSRFGYSNSSRLKELY